MPRRRVFALVVALAALVVGCSDDGADREDGAITEAGKVSVFDVQVGDCLNPGKELAEEITDISAVPCKEPHTHEVFALPEYESEDDLYPGEDKLRGFANAKCLDAFGNYTGADYLESKLFFSYLQPSIRSWNEGDDRRIVCVIVATGEPVEGSVKSAGATTTTAPEGEVAGGDGKSRGERAAESRAEAEVEDQVRDRLGVPRTQDLPGR